MRICSGDYFNWNNTTKRSERVHFEHGKFHEWGIESTAHQIGIAVDSIALVELPNGKIINAISDSIVFNDYENYKVSFAPKMKEFCQYAPLQ